MFIHLFFFHAYPSVFNRYETIYNIVYFIEYRFKTEHWPNNCCFQSQHARMSSSEIKQQFNLQKIIIKRGLDQLNHVNVWRQRALFITELISIRMLLLLKNTPSTYTIKTISNLYVQTFSEPILSIISNSLEHLLKDRNSMSQAVTHS